MCLHGAGVYLHFLHRFRCDIRSAMQVLLGDPRIAEITCPRNGVISEWPPTCLTRLETLIWRLVPLSSLRWQVLLSTCAETCSRHAASLVQHFSVCDISCDLVSP